MRFLLDAHVSGPRIGRGLREAGHDVRALDQEPDLEGLDDQDVLALASSEQRILVSHNVRDFADIVRRWEEGQRPHCGVILVCGIDHREFGLVLRGIERWIEVYPEPSDWSGLAVVLGRGLAGG